MSYSRVGYIPVQRSIVHDANLSRYAYTVLGILQSMAAYKNGASFYQGKARMVLKGEGHFSQVAYCRERGWCTKAFRLALQELAHKGLIEWWGSGLGTKFRLLGKAIQQASRNLRSELGRHALLLKEKSYILTRSYRVSSKMPSNNAQCLKSFDTEQTRKYLKAQDEIEVAKKIPEESRRFLDKLLGR